MRQYTKCMDCTIQERCIRGEVDCWKQQESSEGYDDYCLNIMAYKMIYEEEQAYEKRNNQYCK